MKKQIKQLPAGQWPAKLTACALSERDGKWRWFLRFENGELSTACLFALDVPSVKPVVQIVAEKLDLEWEGDLIEALKSGAIDVEAAIGWTGYVNVQEKDGRFRTFVLKDGDV